MITKISKAIALLVGLLFIFSGLIKLNDPVGTEIKFEEYFDVFAAEFRSKPPTVMVNGEVQNDNNAPAQDTALSQFFEALKPYALSFAIFMSALEVILGINLITGYQKKLTLWLLFLMIVFFTFLTYYSWSQNKVTDCGCFGDAIKLAPFQSFMKDVVLTLLIGYLLFTQKHWSGFATPQIGFIGNLIATIGAFGLGFYTANFQPIIDFLPYKVGNHLPSLMKPKKELRYGEAVYVYTNKQTGEDEKYTQKEFSVAWQRLSDTTKYSYKSYDKPLLNPEDLPKIGPDFKFIDKDSLTKELFNGNKLLIVVAEVRKTDPDKIAKLVGIVNQLNGSPIEAWALSSDIQQFEALRHQYQLPVEHHSMDSKILKTMTRSNPGVLLLKQGTVVGKWSKNNLPTAQALKEMVQ